MPLELTDKDFEQIQKNAPHRCSFLFMGVGLSLASDNPEYIENLKGIYRNFITQHPPEGALECSVLDETPLCSGSCVVMQKKLYAFEKGGMFIGQAEIMIFQKVIDRIDRYLLLHSGVVSRDGHGYIIYAPTGFGKTTFVMELVSRGYRFLSDEYCPVDLDEP